MLRIFLILLLATSSQVASAAMYKWVDERGEVHYSDTLPPHVTSKGPSPDTIKAQEDERQKRKEAEAKEQEQRRRDKILIDSYTSVADIDLARDRNLQATQALIDSTVLRIKSIQKRLDVQRKQAEGVSARGKPVPSDLAAEIAVAEKEMGRLQGNIKKHQQAMEDIRKRYGDDKKRYEELRGKR